MLSMKLPHIPRVMALFPLMFEQRRVCRRSSTADSKPVDLVGTQVDFEHYLFTVDAQTTIE